jgi:predicted DNA-binding transcriptional regulator YafY
MSRTTRLLEILITLQTTSHFTVAQIAEEFDVSRRTMLRDLHALSEMGVPLAAVPGPGGGYSLIRDRRLLPLSLSPDEAIGMILSYEAFLQHAQSPFTAQSLSAITKLRNAMPPDVVRELDRLHEHVVVVQPARTYEAPFLGEVLRASVDGAHLEIVYESVSRVATRLIYPYGLFASQGFWYCACHDGERAADIALRVDRIRALERREDLEPPPSKSIREWLQTRECDAGDMVHLRARVTPKGAKRFELSVLFGEGAVDERGLLEADLPRSELAWFADQLLPLGTDVIVEAPPELVEMILRKVEAIVESLRSPS